MNWMAAQEQREDAAFRVFYMLVALFLLTIRSALNSRGDAHSFPFEGIPPQGKAVEPLPTSDLYSDAVRLLSAIESAARVVSAMMVRMFYEFMAQAHALRCRRVRAAGGFSAAGIGEPVVTPNLHPP